jgi:hypothetical protein
MPWYRAGTISCTQNSTTVTGAGTAFAANARVGDAFLGSDGRWYEVANIASDTVLSILPAYLGATVSAGTYALAPMQGYVKDSADALRTLVNKFGALAASVPINALAALTGATGKFPYFIDAQTMGLATLTDYAKSGQNSDIKALTGLTTPLSVAQGGTGGNSQPYTRSNVVGTVSQSGGSPTGAIVERGSNAGGEYVRFADGTQICWGSSAGATANNSTGAGLYFSGLITVGFPAAFSAAPVLVASTTAQTGAMSWVGYPATYGTLAGYLSLISFGSNATATLQWSAVGRWF